MSGDKFIPAPRTRASHIRHINYTCSPEQYSKMQAAAEKHGVTLKELLRQMVEFALERMS